MAASTNLLIRLRADGKQAISELGRVDAGMDKLRRGVGRAATAGAVALGGLAASSVKEFASFERGMNEVFTLLPDLSAEAMGQVSEQVKDLSSDMGVLTSDVVPALYQSISAGVPEANVFGFLETATQLSIAGVTDLETAVDGLTTITNAYGVENVTAQEAADSLFTAMKLGKTTVGEMSKSLFQVVPAAAAAGITIDEVGAALAAVTAQGTPTRVAATQIRQAIVELGKAGSIAFDAFGAATGETFPSFIRGGGTLQEALQVLAGVAQDSGGSISDMFGSVEAGMSALTLTSDTGAAAWSSNMDEMAAKTGAVVEGFDQMDQGLARGWDRIAALMQVAQIEIGEALAPIVEDFLDAFGDKIPGAAEAVGEAFTDIVGFVENVATGFGIARDAINGMEGPFQSATTGALGFSAALLLISAHPIVGFLVGISVALAELGNNERNAARLGGEFRENLIASGDVASAFAATLNDQEGIDKFATSLEKTGLNLDDLVTVLAGGDDLMEAFTRRLDRAARSGELTGIEVKLLTGVAEDLQQAAAGAAGALLVVAAAEEAVAATGRAATADTILFGQAVDKAAADARAAFTGMDLGFDITGLSAEDIQTELDGILVATEQAMTDIGTSASRAFAEAFVTETKGETTTDIGAAIEAAIADIREQKRIQQLIRSFGSSLPPEFLDGLVDNLEPGLAIEALEELFDDPSSVNRIARETGWNAAAGTQGGFDAFDFNFDPEAGGLSAETMNAFWSIGNNLALLAQAGFNGFNFDFDPGGGDGGTSGSNSGLGGLVGGGTTVGGNVFGHSGGIVPGPIGREVNTTLLGGEKVLTMDQQKDRGQTITIIVEGFIGTRDELTEAVRQGLVQGGSDGSTGISL